MKTPTIILKDKNSWYEFSDMVAEYSTRTLSEVDGCMHSVEASGKAHSGFAAGFVSYEASPAFDSALNTHESDSDFPLIWFGVFKTRTQIEVPITTDRPLLKSLQWTPSISKSDYLQAIEQIKEHIAAGDTYQVNFTYRLSAPCTHKPYSLFCELLSIQNAEFAAFIDIGDYAICSVSPELFFEQAQETITCKPMKGTAPRGYTTRDDLLAAQTLAQTPKERAENIMIVDMIRNDLGRIAQTGSVVVDNLFAVQRHQTLWQMTSTVTAQSAATLPEIFKALFPCASVTGAPKIQTSKIIRKLETTPRKIYTGAIGYFDSDKTARFSVAIRTMLIDKKKQTAEYGIGSGVVWDSTAEAEFAECSVKARVLTTDSPRFSLVESLLWQDKTGFTLLEYHLKRLEDSSSYFDFPFEKNRIIQALDESVKNFNPGSYKVRLLLNSLGNISVEKVAVEINPDAIIKLKLHHEPINSSNRFLYHKTTYRPWYESAMQNLTAVDDILFWNEKGEITETAIANVVFEKEGALFTPPVASGLLGGTYRAWMLDVGKTGERIIHKDEIENFDAVYRINSVRGLQKVSLHL